MFKNLQIELNRFDWSGVSGISDVLMVILSILLLAGLRQGSRSIKESSLSRDADILRWAMSEMDELKSSIKIITDAHKREEFKVFRDKKNGSLKSNWSKAELEAAQAVGVNLQRIGYMALHNLISRNHFMNIWGPMYLASWYALRSWVRHKRGELNEPKEISSGAYSRRYFEQYAMYCEHNLPLLLVENERKRFKQPPLPEEIKSLGGRFKSIINNSVDLDVKRRSL